MEKPIERVLPGEILAADARAGYDDVAPRIAGLRGGPGGLSFLREDRRCDSCDHRRAREQ